MKGRRPRPGMYDGHDASLAQRTVLAVLVGLWLVLAWWLLFGGGIQLAGAWVGRSWQAGDIARRALLGAALSIYFLRLLFTWFAFLKRSVSWQEAFTVALWVLCLFVLLAVVGGTNGRRPGWAVGAGVALFVLGSWTNTFAEYARHRWKKRPENRGRLYTGGLFRYTRHPNYLGDLLSFSGLCLMTGRWETVVIPGIMLAGFVFVNIPMLDAHLEQHYGAAFEEYARRTRKLVPFVY